MARTSNTAMMTIADVNHGRAYPPALRYHIDVVMNPNTFFETLRSFHNTMGTRFMNPVIGGEKLDLYHLYFLVTQRGGIEKVILDGKWREVIAGLNISQTISNRSFVVKKHYYKLLFHYEQVYYFRRRGPIVTPPVPVRQRSHPLFQFVNNSGQAMSLLPQPVFNQGSESPGSVPQHPPLGESQPEDDGNRLAASGDLPSDPTMGVVTPDGLAANANAAPNFMALSQSFRENAPVGARSVPVNMAAHGIGENLPAGRRSVHNSLATRNIGSHVLHGVLQSQLLPASNSSFLFSASSSSAEHPRPWWSAYSFFLEERLSNFRNLPSQSMGELVRLIEESWVRLAKDQRRVYTYREWMDRQRYDREMNEYQERISIRNRNKPCITLQLRENEG